MALLERFPSNTDCLMKNVSDLLKDQFMALLWSFQWKNSLNIVSIQMLLNSYLRTASSATKSWNVLSYSSTTSVLVIDHHGQWIRKTCLNANMRTTHIVKTFDENIQYPRSCQFPVLQALWTKHSNMKKSSNWCQQAGYKHTDFLKLLLFYLNKDDWEC